MLAASTITGKQFKQEMPGHAPSCRNELLVAISIGTEIWCARSALVLAWTYARSALAGHPRGARRLDTAEQEQINSTVRMLTPQVAAAGCQSAPGLLSSTSIHGASERRATLP